MREKIDDKRRFICTAPAQATASRRVLQRRQRTRRMKTPPSTVLVYRAIDDRSVHAANRGLSDHSTRSRTKSQKQNHALRSIQCLFSPINSQAPTLPTFTISTARCHDAGSGTGHCLNRHFERASSVETDGANSITQHSWQRAQSTAFTLDLTSFHGGAGSGQSDITGLVTLESPRLQY